MFFSFSAAWAQGGATTPSGGILIPAIGSDYHIEGDDSPALYKEYTYTREMPAGNDDVYWHIEGAATINGDSAGTYPDGSLIASKEREIRVQWEDTSTIRSLQLRRGDGEKVYVLAELLVRGTSITNQIMYHGQGPNYAPKIRSTAIYTCALNPVDPNPTTGGVSGEPHQFQMESNCSGNSGQPWNSCSPRPNFVWTVRYYTATGTFIEEKYADMTYNDFSKAWLFLYTRIPALSPDGIVWFNAPSNAPGFPISATNPCLSNICATNRNGYRPFAWWLRGGGCPNFATPTASPGDIVTRVNIQCTGYSCGGSLQPDSDEINVYYLGLPPQPITLVNSPALPLCRGQSYQVETAGTTGANGYTWTASNGAQVVGIPGTGSERMTLNLANVPATATSVTVTVTPATGSTICAGAQQTTTLVIPLSPAPAPQNMRLLGGSCASLSPKTVLIDPEVMPGTEYEWSLTGGAYFQSNSSPGNPSIKGPPFATSTEVIVTPNAVPVTVTVRKKLTPCGGFGPPISTTYPIGNLSPGPGQPITQRNECAPYDTKLIFETVPSGLSYFPISVANVSSPGIVPTFTSTTPGGPVFDIGGVGSGRVYFDLTYFVTSPCPGPGVPGGQQYTRNIFIQKLIGGVQCRGVAGTPPPPVAEPLLELYPNPTSGAVDVKTDETTHYQWVKVFDAQGSLRYQQQSDAPAGIKSFDLKALTPGIYLVQLFDGEHLASQRLVKE